jgi:adenosylhomocysteine nucleosidase
MAERIIGVMGAMHEEINSIVQLMDDPKEYTHGQRIYTVGTINNIKTVVVFSRWGKVAAAITVSSLIIEFKITELIFMGVAGAINDALKIGDIVIANQLIQHDMDARPLMEKYEIPLLGKTYFESDLTLLAAAEEAGNKFIHAQFHEFIKPTEIERFALHQVKLRIGHVASGDQFFASQHHKDSLLSALPETLCVEMEGAAVAQVCYEYHLPFIVIRVISDESNAHSAIDFPDFIANVSSKYAQAVIKNMFYAINSIR